MIIRYAACKDSGSFTPRILKQAFFCFLLTAFIFSEELEAAEVSISQRFEEFTRLLETADHAQSISQKRLHSFPTALLTSDGQYPQLNNFSWNDIQLLFDVRQTCHWQKSR